ncbi:hypothetical protein [Streptomyces sp. NBC_00691]|uniref:hypothetical protein n=1 Tax=Streptomyces sp. NBC_00691 TaxID=2903671 RepID=UPI002E326996|nr:hypothetical protein [Streptomyces sp. NBC_00691]
MTATSEVDASWSGASNRPAVPRGANAALLGFTGADLLEQAQAISSGAPYELRVRVTGP